MRRWVALIALGCSAPAWALDYFAVAEAAPLYDAPSAKAQPVYAVAAGTPVEAVVMLDTWVKVRDSKGDLAWIEKRLLAQKRTVIVRVDRAQVRAQADEQAALAFEAERDTVLEWVEPGPLGWVRVRHRDGAAGFVKIPQVWGA